MIVLEVMCGVVLYVRFILVTFEEPELNLSNYSVCICVCTCGCLCVICLHVCVRACMCMCVRVHACPCFACLLFLFIFYRTMEPLKSLSGAERKTLYKMAIGSHGIWMTYRSLVFLSTLNVTHQKPYNSSLTHVSKLTIIGIL